MRWDWIVKEFDNLRLVYNTYSPNQVSYEFFEKNKALTMEKTICLIERMADETFAMDVAYGVASKRKELLKKYRYKSTEFQEFRRQCEDRHEPFDVHKNEMWDFYFALKNGTDAVSVHFGLSDLQNSNI